MTEELVLGYLRQNRHKLNLKGIAQAAGLAYTTVRSYAEGERGKRGLPAETVAALTAALEGLRPEWQPIDK